MDYNKNWFTCVQYIVFGIFIAGLAAVYSNIHTDVSEVNIVKSGIVLACAVVLGVVLFLFVRLIAAVSAGIGEKARNLAYEIVVILIFGLVIGVRVYYISKYCPAASFGGCMMGFLKPFAVYFLCLATSGKTGSVIGLLFQGLYVSEITSCYVFDYNSVSTLVVILVLLLYSVYFRRSVDGYMDNVSSYVLVAGIMVTISISIVISLCLGYTLVIPAVMAVCIIMNMLFCGWKHALMLMLGIPVLCFLAYCSTNYISPDYQEHVEKEIKSRTTVVEKVVGDLKDNPKIAFDYVADCIVSSREKHSDSRIVSFGGYEFGYETTVDIIFMIVAFFSVIVLLFKERNALSVYMLYSIAAYIFGADIIMCCILVIGACYRELYDGAFEKAQERRSLRGTSKGRKKQKAEDGFDTDMQPEFDGDAVSVSGGMDEERTPKKAGKTDAVSANKPEEPIKTKRPASESGYEEPVKKSIPVSESRYDEPIKTSGLVSESRYDEPIKTDGLVSENRYDEPIKTSGLVSESRYDEPIKTNDLVSESRYEEPIKTSGLVSESRYDEPINTSGLVSESRYDEPIKTDGLVSESRYEEPIKTSGLVSESRYDEPIKTDGLVSESRYEEPIKTSSLVSESRYEEPIKTNGLVSESRYDEPIKTSGLASESRYDEPINTSGLALESRYEEPVKTSGLVSENRYEEPVKTGGFVSESRQQEPVGFGGMTEKKVLEEQPGDSVSAGQSGLMIDESIDYVQRLELIYQEVKEKYPELFMDEDDALSAGNDEYKNDISSKQEEEKAAYDYLRKLESISVEQKELAKPVIPEEPYGRGYNQEELIKPVIPEEPYGQGYNQEELIKPVIPEEPYGQGYNQEELIKPVIPEEPYKQEYEQKKQNYSEYLLDEEPWAEPQGKTEQNIQHEPDKQDYSKYLLDEEPWVEPQKSTEQDKQHEPEKQDYSKYLVDEEPWTESRGNIEPVIRPENQMLNTEPVIRPENQTFEPEEPVKREYPEVPLDENPWSEQQKETKETETGKVDGSFAPAGRIPVPKPIINYDSENSGRTIISKSGELVNKNNFGNNFDREKWLNRKKRAATRTNTHEDE